MRWAAALAIGLGALTGMPAWAQPKIAPTRAYSSTPPAGLDKDYGLPTFGTPGAAMPQQRTQAPKPPAKDDADFFATAPRRDPDAPDVPDFFTSTTDLTLPKAAKPIPGTASPETPRFTTSEGYTTGDRPSGKLETDDTPKGNGIDD